LDLRGKEENMHNFFHNGLKNIELHGCVCTISILRSVNSLK